MSSRVVIQLPQGTLTTTTKKDEDTWRPSKPSQMVMDARWKMLRFVILAGALAEKGMREMRKHDCTFYLPFKRAEIHLSPSKAAFLSQPAFYFIIPVFIHLDVGFWEARAEAQPQAVTQTAEPQISPPSTCWSQKITPTQTLRAKTGIERR